MDLGWWNRVLYWAGLEPTEYYDSNGKKRYHFKSKKHEVYCSFSPWFADSAEGGGPTLHFYEKIGPGDREEDYQKIDKEGIPKFCVDGKIRGLLEEKRKQKPRDSVSWSG